MDEMNENFFRPRGLYCLIMSYDPMGITGKENVDPLQAMTDHKANEAAGGSLPSKVKKNLRNPSAGVSQGERNLPDSAATLVYPDMEPSTQPNHDSSEQKKTFSRLNKYFDRRARARYVRLWHKWEMLRFD